jgi:PRTRC genetic system protein B
MDVLLPQIGTRTLTANIDENNPDVRATLYFLNDQYLLRSKSDQGVTDKLVAGSDLALVFNDTPIDSDWFPPNTLRWGLKAGKPWIALYIPAGKAIVHLPEPFIVPLPPLVFFGHDRNYRVRAIRKGYPSPSSPLFHAPFPNVYDDGRICFGSNTVPVCDALTVESVWHLFLESSFIAHLDNRKSVSNPSSIIPVLKGLAGKSKYPLKDLVPCNETLETFTRKLLT